jgi:hypothetical protein
MAWVTNVGDENTGRAGRTQSAAAERQFTLTGARRIRRQDKRLQQLAPIFAAPLIPVGTIAV